MPTEMYQQYLKRCQEQLFEHFEHQQLIFYPFKHILIRGSKG